MNKFSSVESNVQNEGWLELRYDNAIRVVMPLGLQVAAPAAGSPLGAQAASSLQLQGSGITPLSCTEPDCVKGVPSVTQPLPTDLSQVWIDLLVAANLEVTDCGAPCLVIRGSGEQIAIPMFDAWVGTGKALERALAGSCKLFGMKECVAYHVYLITDAPVPLAALRNKLIALPIPGECVEVPAAAKPSVAA